VFVIYLGSLLSGGVLIAASALGAGHDGEAPAGGDVDAGARHEHDRSPARARLALFGIPFWSFGATFFGLAGLVMRALGSPGLAPFVAAAVGVIAGLGAAVGVSGGLGAAVGVGGGLGDASAPGRKPPPPSSG
jgi:hypothetical protein